MSDLRNWQSVQHEVRRRIHAREWVPGDMIPNEADLAQEFGCARATVNRALRGLAETGLLDRRRKAGTRVALRPDAKATLTIAVIRVEVEGRGQSYHYSLLSRALTVPPAVIGAALKVAAGQALLHLTALHLADGAPYALEDRWINQSTVPAATREQFDTISSNEWLLIHAPYTHGEIAFSADLATPDEAAALGCAAASALFVTDRMTWDHARSVTKVRLIFAPGYQMRAAL
jgi:GntR family histidine utilization transcriptional repressor